MPVHKETNFRACTEKFVPLRPDRAKPVNEGALLPSSHCGSEAVSIATANAIEHTCPLKSRYVIIPAFFSEADQFYDLTMLDSK